MSKKKDAESAKVALVYEVDPTECPFREFRDNELSLDLWGLSPAATRAAVPLSKSAPKGHADFIWVDDQTQPLPRSVRQYLHGWVRAETLAEDRWNAEVVVFEESNSAQKMSIIDMQLSHAQVLLRSAFVRKVLSACFMLERVESLVVEHQWENFICNFGPEGWRARYHIYSPGMKPGGGVQHRPLFSKTGCYLVRLYYLGAWRCVWVSDQVPVDATDSPLLPFSPLLSRAPPAKPGMKPPGAMVLSHVVYLWPLLICKALLKLAAPDMSSDEYTEIVEDESMPEFNILHALTGGLDIIYNVTDVEGLWQLITTEISVFSWEDDDDTVASTIKSKTTKKPANRDAILSRRPAMATLDIIETKDCPNYMLPGITPAHEMTLLVSMARDQPLKKPLPEPEVALWKYYRWVDWARRHGLYEAYDCPRTRFLKVNGLMKMSYAPHLLDVQSTESITQTFREEHEKGGGVGQARNKQKDNQPKQSTTPAGGATTKEEIREWIQYEPMVPLVKKLNIIYYPSMFQFTTATSHPPTRIGTRNPPNKALDITGSKYAPLYMEIDGPEDNKLRIALSMLHPRLLINSGIPIAEYIEPAYLVLEKFEWFEDNVLPLAKAYIKTRGYDSVDIEFQPGRHFCRLWVHSRMNWHVMLLSESTLLLGPRDVIQSAAIHECPWANRFLSNLSSAFINWIRVNRSNNAIVMVDREFFKSYQPDLLWDPELVGYTKSHVHWMFRQALRSLLSKRLQHSDFQAVCYVLRHYFCDPDFGLPEKPRLSKSLIDIDAEDPCDCLMPEIEDVNFSEELLEEQAFTEEKPLISPSMMARLCMPPEPPLPSQICELATDEVPCGVLKDIRRKIMRRHEAAICIQSHWRGTWVRRCLFRHIVFTPEVTKIVMENAFGNYEALSSLMNEFFAMYPGTRKAYSISSALSGVYGYQHHSGVSPVSSRCKWVPYFQALFYCHMPVKVHFDLRSNIQNSTLAVFNNDTSTPMPQAHNAHITFDFVPNSNGYTVLGHGTLKQVAGIHHDAHWSLTILSSIDKAFHGCDNEPEGCKEQHFGNSYKLHVDEIFLPNRRNILGSLLVSVTKHECVSFRAAATSPDLDIIATLRTTSLLGDPIVLGQCTGKGEIYWPFLRLEPSPPQEVMAKKANFSSHANLTSKDSSISSARSTKAAKSARPLSAKIKSTTKLSNLKGENKPAPVEPKQYIIEVTAPHGWPLSLAQWKRVDEIRNTPEKHIEPALKKPAKPSSAKEKEKEKEKPVQVVVYVPHADDAYVELECSLATGGGAYARRDDSRDLEFQAARKSWDAKEPGRNLRGSQIRKDFRSEYLEAIPIAPSSVYSSEDVYNEEIGEEQETKDSIYPFHQGPSPVSSGLLMEAVESEEETKYLTMPEQLRDKFMALYFLPFCMKDKNEEESVIITNDMAEAAKCDRHARIEASLERMNELQMYNEVYVLSRQKQRCHLLEKLFVDSQWPDELMEVLEEKDDAIAREALARSLSAAKKKQDTKDQQTQKKTDDAKKKKSDDRRKM